MGFFDFLSGGNMNRALSYERQQSLGPWEDAMGWMGDQYSTAESDYMSQFADLMGRQSQIQYEEEDFTQQYQDLVTNFQEMADSARSDLLESFEQERGYLGVGKESALEQVGLSFEQMRGESLASSISSGLAGTSFGSSQQRSITRSEGFAKSDIETGYASRFAESAARQGQQVSAFDQWSIGGQSNLAKAGTDYSSLRAARIAGFDQQNAMAGIALGANYATGLANLRGSWTDRIMGGERVGMEARTGFGDRALSQRQSQQDRNAAMFGGLLGGFGF